MSPVAKRRRIPQFSKTGPADIAEPVFRLNVEIAWKHVAVVLCNQIITAVAAHRADRRHSRRQPRQDRVEQPDRNVHGVVPIPFVENPAQKFAPLARRQGERLQAAAAVEFDTVDVLLETDALLPQVVVYVTAAPVGITTVAVVQGRRAVDADSGQKTIFMQETPPLVVKPGAIGLERVENRRIAPVSALKLHRLPEETDARKGRFAPLPAELVLFHRAGKVTAYNGFQRTGGHAVRCGAEQLLFRQVKAVPAVQVAAE